MFARKLIRIAVIAAVLIAGHSALAGISVGTLTLEREARPGEVYRGTLQLLNSDTIARTASVYQTDYLFYSDGSNTFSDPGSMPRSNASWLTFSPHEVEVPPQQSALVSYEIHVPADSTLQGTYWSMLMIEEIEEAVHAALHLRKHQAGVRQVVRYGVQCVTQIAETGNANLNFTGTQLVSEHGSSPELQVDVENVGDLSLSPIAWLELYDGNGKKVGRFEAEKKRIYPGTSVRFRMNLGNTPSGQYKALVVLDNGDQNVFGAKYDLEF